MENLRPAAAAAAPVLPHYPGYACPGDLPDFAMDLIAAQLDAKSAAALATTCRGGARHQVDPRLTPG